ncbi:hypothetical protein NHX12_027217 [Muraenolepis orangiensis]|uniref:MABP domain-containing protein n=1 Tax=Muraenolepis orangiensis TaxID=630683 RepID=A0A9Q0EBY6_9TELE|nr:hypothetical protein NHX12_027217 [Muraenolepis orangiensis]
MSKNIPLCMSPKTEISRAKYPSISPAVTETSGIDQRRRRSVVKMPEVRELSEALPEMPMDPITGVGVVSTTTDGLDADLWKDGLFKSKVTRYLCFTRVFSKENSHLGNVLVDMKLIDIKDTLPVGFIPIQETVDTQEHAFRKRRLCIKFIPRDSTEAAISMDGVPFIISEKFACTSSDLQQVDLMGITIKSLAEIEKEYDYSFRTEHSAAARLPPSPTRTSLSSEA